MDFGHTIAYEERETAEIYRNMLEEVGHPRQLDEVRRALQAALTWVRDRNARLGGIWDVQSLVDQSQRMLLSLGIASEQSLAKRLAEMLPHRLNYKAYDDVEPTLAALKEMGLCLVMVSNVSSLQNLKLYLAQVRLTDHFEALVASGTLGVEKPDPRIFTIASEMSGTPVESLLHVGDSYESDYLGAEKAGATGVVIDRDGRYSDKRCRRISKLTELIQMLRPRVI